jgi:hypothetical protein
MNVLINCRQNYGAATAETMPTDADAMRKVL